MSAVPDYDRSATLTRTDDLRVRVAPGGGVAARADWPTAPWEFERRYQVLGRAEYEALRAWVEANAQVAVTTEDPDGATVQCAIRDFRAEALAAGLWRCTLVLWELVPAQVETVPSIDATTINKVFVGYEFHTEPKTHPTSTPEAACTIEHLKHHIGADKVITYIQFYTRDYGGDCYYQVAPSTSMQNQLIQALYVCPAGYTANIYGTCTPDNPKTCPVADPPYTLSADGLTCSRPLL